MNRSALRAAYCFIAVYHCDRQQSSKHSRRAQNDVESTANRSIYPGAASAWEQLVPWAAFGDVQYLLGAALAPTFA